MKSRSQALETAATEEFDVVVVGGGIVGAGVAQNAASRGLSVLLMERDDFASGTSSKTTKLIHGGLRYLEQLHFHLTQELCHERGLLEQLAPHMVRDFSFILPVSKQKLFFGLKAEIGLTLYDILAMSAPTSHPHQRIGQKELLTAAPSLDEEQFLGGLRFHDCITDDSRLVMEVIKSASREGAICLNYLEAINFEIKDGQVTAVECKDRIKGTKISVKAKHCVNAAGVWTDELLHIVDKSWHAKVKPAKGTHILVPPSAFETNTALFLPTKDNRYVFVVPWQRALMIGTTDTGYQGDINNPLPTGDEIDYLLDVVNGYAGGKQLTRADVIAAWAGLRPLVAGEDVEGGKTGNLSREHEIFEGPGKMVGLIGGKLTNYRLMAAQVVGRITSRFSEEERAKIKMSRTQETMLGGWNSREDFLAQTASIAARARKLSIEPSTHDHLVASYGRDANLILDIVEKESSLNTRICPDFPHIMAEVPYCVLNEFSVSLEDLLFRRMRLGMLHQIQCLEAAPKVSRLVQSLLDWDDARTEAELVRVEDVLNEHINTFRAPVTQVVG